MSLRLPARVQLDHQVSQAVAQVLSHDHVGSWSSDHKKEASALSGFNYLGIAAISRQGARAHGYVYRDKSSEAVGMRKSLRAQYGATWKQQVQDGTAELADDAHYISQLVRRPNNGQSAASFQWEFIQQMHLHGCCLIFNRQTLDRSRTAARYILPMSMTEPVYPGQDPQCPEGGVRILPYLAGLGWMNSYVTRLMGKTIPISRISIIRYPHSQNRGDGQSPTSAAGWWIDTSTMIDMQRWKQIKRGPRPFGVVSVKVGTGDKGQVTEGDLDKVEDRLNDKLDDRDYDDRAIALGTDFDLSQNTTPEEMDYVNAFDQLGQATLAVHGVGKAFVGMGENHTYGSNAAAHQFGLTVVQSDLDFLADDWTQLAEDEGEAVAVEYEVQPIEDKDLTEKQMQLDVQAGQLRGKEYRAKRGLPPWGDWRDEARVTSAGFVDDRMGPGATSAGGMIQAGGVGGALAPERPKPTGEWAGLSRLQVIRNRKAIEDVLTGLKEKTKSPTLARVELAMIGMDSGNIDLLLAIGRSSGRSAGQPAARGTEQPGHAQGSHR